jgi:hypothetical protein
MWQQSSVNADDTDERAVKALVNVFVSGFKTCVAAASLQLVSVPLWFRNLSSMHT